MRLDKFLNDRLQTGREAVKKQIRSGLVTVNGNTIKDPGFKVNEADSVGVEGTSLSSDTVVCYLLYKPSGFLTARTDPDHKVVMELIPRERKDLSPVGRLDLDTEGVLLITNDGDLNHRLTSPNFHVKKKYYVECSPNLPENARQILEAPIVFKDFTSKPGEFEQLTENSCYLTISEGKFHQVKRMIARLGCEVTYLRRETFGPLDLTGLSRGEFRILTKEEIDDLRNRN